MERNYDELISEMLRQINRHTEELIKQSEKSDAFWAEQRLINADHLAQLRELRVSFKDQTAVMNQNQATALQTAAILDRIIKENKLKL